MKNFIVFAVFALTTLGGGTALADSACKDVNIKVTNSFKDGNNSKKIKVLAVNYYDSTDKKWRDNDLNNTEVSVGAQATVTETLEYVENEDVTQLQVKFQFLEDKGWSSDKWSNVKVTTDPKCVKGKVYTITVTGTAAKK